MPQLMPLSWVYSFLMICLIMVAGVVIYSNYFSNDFEKSLNKFEGVLLNWWW